MATDYAKRALQALEDAQVDIGDSASQTNKELATAIVYAVLDLARAVRSK